MCLGVPMVVVESTEWVAECAVPERAAGSPTAPDVGLASLSDPGPRRARPRRATRRRVSLALLGPQDAGTWLLVHIDTAIRVLDAAEAGQILDALSAVEAARAGGGVEAFFSDLSDREPQLPEHLRLGSRRGGER